MKFTGSTAPAILFIKNNSEGQKLQDYASSRCTITYRAPELFNVEVNSTIDQRTDIWVMNLISDLNLKCIFQYNLTIIWLFLVSGMLTIRAVFLQITI